MPAGDLEKAALIRGKKTAMLPVPEKSTRKDRINPNY
jgi:hypothetical protein